MTLRWWMIRCVSLVPALLGVSVITFMLAGAVPGDPVHALVGERADPEIIAAYRDKLGLDQNLGVRYARYAGMLLKGDLGQSTFTRRPVLTELVEKLPNTLALAVVAMGIAVVLGLSLGGLAAMRRGTWLDKSIVFLATLFISFPVFWYGMVLVFIFSVHLRWFPVGGMEHPLAVVLPAVTLGSRSAGYLTRLTRTKILDSLGAEYITLVRAKGGDSWAVFRHAFRNAVIPVVTFIGLDFGSYLNGSVLTETIFGWDGLGRYAIQGIFRRDYPVILGTVLFGALIFMVVNLLIDALYFFLNPRVRGREST